MTRSAPLITKVPLGVISGKSPMNTLLSLISPVDLLSRRAVTRSAPEYLLETFLKEPLVGSLLNLDKVRHIDYFINFTEAHALGIAQLYGFDINHMRIHTPSFFLVTTGL